MIRVLAIDDEPLALQQLVGYIKKIPFFELAAQCQSAIEAREYMDREPVDAIFCDINMPDLSGMEFVRQLPVRPAIVFTTAYSEYAIEGYKVDAVDYLLKPFGFSDFQRAAERIRTRMEQSAPSAAAATQPDDDTIFVKSDYRMMRLSIRDICYVEAMSEYLKIHLSSQPKPIITLLSMKKMEEFLPSAQFMRIHRGYIVNLNHVVEVNKNRVLLDADTWVPIGDNYKEAFNHFLEKRYLGR